MSNIERQHQETTDITSVPLLDLKSQYQSIKTEIDQAIAEVCESQHFIMGPVVQRFEEAVASYSNSKFAIGVSSGSDALLIALMALEIEHGHDVITSPFTFFATGGAIARVGATPVFCDIDPETYNLSAASVEQFIESNCDFSNGTLTNKLTGNTVKTIIPVHLFGQTADMPAIMAVARKYGLTVIEDAAQAIGAQSATGDSAGTIGDIGCFSFFPSKNLGAFGDAGMVVCNDPEIAERLKILRVHGGKPKYYHSFIGGNFRLDAIQAAVLEVKLKYLDKWTRTRQLHAHSYNELLADSAYLKRPTETPGGRHIYNQYTLLVDEKTNRDEVRSYLSEHQIGSEIYYPVPLHLQECFKYLGYSAGDFPISENAAESVFSIPVHPELTVPEMEYVAEKLNSYNK